MLPSNNINSENNEQLLILNNIMNNNLTQINDLNNYLKYLNESNRQIRNLRYQILHRQRVNRQYNQRQYNQRQYNQRQYNQRQYNQRENNLSEINQRQYNQRENNQSENNQRNNYMNNIPQQNINIPSRVYLNTIPNIFNSNINPLPINGNIDLTRFLQNFFQPVEIHPTQIQIERATRIVKYCDIVTPRNRSCPISLENFQENQMVTRIRFCGHIFNSTEINIWFRSHCICPVCRYDIRNYNEQQTISNSNSSEQQNNFSEINTNETTTSTTNERENISNITREQYQEILYRFFIDASNNLTNNNILNLDDDIINRVISIFNRR